MEKVVDAFNHAPANKYQDAAEAARREMEVNSFGAVNSNYIKVFHKQVAAWLLDEYDMDVCFCNGVIVLNVAGMDIEYTPEGFDDFFMEVTE